MVTGHWKNQQYMQSLVEYYENQEKFLMHTELCHANRRRWTEEDLVRHKYPVQACWVDITIVQQHFVQRSPVCVGSRFQSILKVTVFDTGYMPYCNVKYFISEKIGDHFKGCHHNGNVNMPGLHTPAFSEKVITSGKKEITPGELMKHYLNKSQSYNSALAFTLLRASTIIPIN